MPPLWSLSRPRSNAGWGCANIGKIAPFGVTIDFETCGERGPELQDTVTLRHRDSGEQEFVTIRELPGKLLRQMWWPSFWRCKAAR